MRPVRQLKIITSQLELLDDLRNQLDSLLLYINNVMKIGESWIERREDTKTFLEVNSLLVNETSNCIQKCLDIARDNQELFETGSSNEQSSIKYSSEQGQASNYNSRDESDQLRSIARKDELEKSLSSLTTATKSNSENCTTLLRYYDSVINLTNTHSETLQIMDQALKNQEKQLAVVLKNQADIDRVNRSRFDEISKDLLASKESIKCIQSSEAARNAETAEKNKATTSDPLNATKSISACISEEFEFVKGKVAALERKVNQTFLNKSSPVAINDNPLGTFDMPIIFDASVEDSDVVNIRKDEILTCFKVVIFNKRNYFNPTTGRFTSPHCGLYQCSLFIDINQDQDLQFCVCRRTVNGNENIVVTTHSRVKNTMVCDIGFVEMNVNDQLYVKASGNCSQVKFNFYSHFMCILVKKYY